jgi:oligopeptide/dipeptide ABC transporter ATP-binding protein
MQPLLSLRNLTTRFKTDDGVVTAVDRVSFDLMPGEFLGLVGESGCGKTVCSKSIMRLLPEHTSFFSKESEILLDGENLAFAHERIMRKVRGNRIGMIFQEPMTALNPVFTVGWQIEEALQYHTKLNRQQRRARTVEMLRLVGIPNPEQRVNEYPHQLSGGMRQRVVIAIALCCEPDILIADEPTTALDVTIQAQILYEAQKLARETGTALIWITHDLTVVAGLADRICVMYAGRIVEEGKVDDVLDNPLHPYTRGLIGSVPSRNRRGTALYQIPGMTPSLIRLPKGCAFRDRCSQAEEKCCEPPAITYPAPGRAVRCCCCPTVGESE